MSQSNTGLDLLNKLITDLEIKTGLNEELARKNYPHYFGSENLLSKTEAPVEEQKIEQPKAEAKKENSNKEAPKQKQPKQPK